MTTADGKEAAAAAYLVPRLEILLKRCIAKAEEYKQHRSTVSDIGVNSCSHPGVHRVLALLQFILNHDFADDEPRCIGTTEDFDPEDEYIDMPELSLEDDSADCDFDFMPDITGSSKSKRTSDQAKENSGYKTVQQYMANLSGIEAYRAMLDIVYTYDLLKKPFLVENYVSSMPMIGRLQQLGYDIRTPVVNIPEPVTQHFQDLQANRQLSSKEKSDIRRAKSKNRKARCQQPRKKKPGENSVLVVVQDKFKIWNLQYKHIQRFNDYIRNGQRKLSISIVSDYVYDKFLEARAEQQAVSDLDITAWARIAGDILDISGFQASSGWIYKFKQHHSIVSRRVVKQVSVVSNDKLQQREAQDEERTASLREAVAAAGISNTLNVDETCLLHEKGNKRTLAISGEKSPTALVMNKNDTTHSHTGIFSLFADGRVGSFAIIYQEVSGKFPDRVRPVVQEAAASIEGLTISTSKSGKAMSTHSGYLMDNMIGKMVKKYCDDECTPLLLMDNYGAHKIDNLNRINENGDIFTATLTRGAEREQQQQQQQQSTTSTASTNGEDSTSATNSVTEPTTDRNPAIVAVPLDSKEEDWPAKKPVVRVGYFAPGMTCKRQPLDVGYNLYFKWLQFAVFAAVRTYNFELEKKLNEAATQSEELNVNQRKNTKATTPPELKSIFLRDRITVMNITAAIIHQLRAPVFRSLFQDAWYRAGLADKPDEEHTTPSRWCKLDAKKPMKCGHVKSDDKVCNNRPFIQCAYESCRMHLCILCFAINDIHKHDDQDLQQDNDTAVEQGKEQGAAITTKRKRKARDQDAADDNVDNDDSNGTVATDTPTRKIVTRRSLMLRQDGQTVPTAVDIGAAANDENVPPTATTSTQQPNSNKRQKVDNTTTTATNNGTTTISQIQPPVTRSRARLPRVSGTSTRANPSSASSG